LEVPPSGSPTRELHIGRVCGLFFDSLDTEHSLSFEVTAGKQFVLSPVVSARVCGALFLPDRMNDAITPEYCALDLPPVCYNGASHRAEDQNERITGGSFSSRLCMTPPSG